MHVALVNMPWAAMDVPSLALGILTTCAQDLDGVTARVHHGNLEYVDWLTSRCAISHKDYEYFAIDSYFFGYGDWVFSSALYDDPGWRVDAFVSHANAPGGGSGPRITPESLNLALRMHELAPRFIDDYVTELLEDRPDVVGFTTTFQTSIAALAAARRIKEIRPDIPIVFGGANCDDRQGAALHRNFRFVDYVVRGEGEVTFPQLLRSVAAGAPVDGIPGLCWRRPDGTSVANAMATTSLPTRMLRPPNYDGYVERLERSTARDWVEPKLVVEGARGCWWGEKHHCTFCGLNGSSMTFRSKDPDAYLAEILHLARRYQILDMFVVDNILDMNYMATLVPALIGADYDFRFHYEVKSNLREQQLSALGQAGMVMLQPGIENLSTEVLRIMRKGVTGPQNIRFLRNSESLGITASWNYLYGFPGEREEHYRSVMGQLAGLHHLPPPAVACRLAIERFSPYFSDPRLGFDVTRPDSQYGRNLDLPEGELFDLAYIFSAPHQGIGEDLAGELRMAVDLWQEEYSRSHLTYIDTGDAILLTSQRRLFDWGTLDIRSPLEVAMFRLLSEPHSRNGLVTHLTRPGFPAPDGSDIESVIASWQKLGILFEDGGQLVHVVATHENQDVLHIKTLDERVASALRGM
jgi:ribosomal peptide maturation radical SAM protein 1